MEKVHEFDLNKINKGAVPDLVAHEMEKIMANINDINVPADKPRKLIVEISIHPNGDRSGATTEVQVSSKLPGFKPHKGSLHFDLRNNRLKAFSSEIHQMGMFDDAKKEDTTAE